MKFSVREFRPEDFPKLLQLDYEGYPPELRYSETDMRKALSDPEIVCFMVDNEVGETIAGFLLKIKKFQMKLNVLSITVQRNYRNFGVGSLIVKQIFSIGNYLRLNRIELQIAANNLPAIKLLEKHHATLETSVDDFATKGNKAYIYYFDIPSTEPQQGNPANSLGIPAS